MDINEFDPQRRIRSALSFVALASFFAPWGLISEHPRSPIAWLGAVGLWVLSIVLTVSVVSDSVPWAWLPPRTGTVHETEAGQVSRREPLLEVRIHPRARANLPVARAPQVFSAVDAGARNAAAGLCAGELLLLGRAPTAEQR
jgi:hypothetical protein